MYTTEELDKYFAECGENFTRRQIQNRVKKALAERETALNAPLPDSISFSICWKKSATWGNNPHLSAKIYFENPYSVEHFSATCSGCGYDKESEVISRLFNAYFKGILARKMAETAKDQRPYGLYDGMILPFYDGGIGTDCYYKIADFIGYKMIRTYCGETEDGWTLTKKGEKNV